MRLRRSNTDHTPVAATVTAFSTYLIGLCILLSLSSTRELELSPRSPQLGSLRIQDFIHRETYLRNPEASMRGMGQTHAIESVTFRHEEGNEGWKNGVKRGNRAFYGANLLKRQGDRVDSSPSSPSSQSLVIRQAFTKPGRRSQPPWAAPPCIQRPAERPPSSAPPHSPASVPENA